MAQRHHADGLVVGDHAFELQAAQEQGLVGAGALLHDAGDAGIVIVPQAEGLRAVGEPSLPHLEGKGAVEGEDERAAGPVCSCSFLRKTKSRDSTPWFS